MGFRRLDTRLEGLVLIEPDVFPDERGFFLETYRENEWWWEPIRSGEYRDYYERQYGQALK